MSENDFKTLPLHFTLSKTGYHALQKYPKFRNQDLDREYAEELPLDSKQANAFFQLSRRIRYYTSYSVTAEQKHHDRKVIKYLCRRLITMNKARQGYELHRKLPDDLSGYLLPIFSELVINAQKAVFEELLKEQVVENTVIKAYTDRFMNPPDNRANWVKDDKVRLILSLIAQKMNMLVSAFFEQSPTMFCFGLQNNSFLNYRTQKILNDRVQESIREGSSIVENYVENERNMGAGIGLILARQSIEELAKEADIYWDLRPERTEEKSAIMKIELLLDKAFIESPRKA